VASGENFVQRVFAHRALLGDDLPSIEVDADRDAVLKELRDLVDSVPHLIVIIGPDGERLYANRQSLDYFGCTIEEFCSAEFLRNFCHPEDYDELCQQRQQISRGQPFEGDTRMRRPDGSYRWFHFYYWPCRDGDGRISKWYVTATEIDECKRAAESLQKENLALREEIERVSMFEEIVGGSAALRAVLSRVTKVAPTESTVLITGETGTGKELIARAIHKRSERAARAFVSVNCASIPQTLIASELFGHEKGAFTGAMQRRTGRFEMAEGGTLFLDEVEDLPADTQIALLRVLQERQFERIGGTQTVRADVRVIAATNRDLETAIEDGKFRSDLFYRLNVFPIDTPPLRERKEDIPMLVAYFVQRYARRAGRQFGSVSKKSLELLETYGWPGNVRELQNVIERSVIVSDTDIFSVDESWIPRGQERVARLRSESPRVIPTKQDRVKRERDVIEAALAAARGRVSGQLGAAAKLGVPPSTLESRIRSLQIDKHRFKHGAVDSVS